MITNIIDIRINSCTCIMLSEEHDRGNQVRSTSWCRLHLMIQVVHRHQLWALYLPKSSRTLQKTLRFAMSVTAKEQISCSHAGLYHTSQGFQHYYWRDTKGWISCIRSRCWFSRESQSMERPAFFRIWFVIGSKAFSDWIFWKFCQQNQY